MRKKVFFIALIASTFTTQTQAANNNPATVEYVQSQMTSIINYVKSQLTNIPAVTTNTLGQHAMGGIVFYVDTSGHHGLAASRVDLSIKATWHEAKKLTGSHPFDWHLPNRNELKLLYEQRNLVGDFANHLYWSSTESDSFNAWFHNFYIGNQFSGNKNLTHRVRTVREF